MNLVSIQLLKIHPKNSEYYSDLSPEKYEEVKNSIRVNGIRDPLKVLPDYTIIAGHQRFKIAQELGLEKVPVVIIDVTPEEAEYLLIADNEERRQDDNDPIKKAKRAKFLKEYWGVRHGNNQYSRIPQNEESKTSADVAKAVGTTAKNLNRLLKLNDLIPELQELVSSNKLGATAAEQLAYLDTSVQQVLWDTLGEEIAQKTIAETKVIRQEVEIPAAEQEKTEKLEQKITLLTENIEDAEKTIKEFEEIIVELEDALEKAENKPPKEVTPPDYKNIKTELQNSKAELKKVQEQSAILQETLTQTQSELEKKKDDIRALTKAQLEALNKQKVRTTLSFLVQDIGKHLNQCKLEIESFACDETTYDDVMAAAKILRNTADELETLVNTYNCEVITIVK